MEKFMFKELFEKQQHSILQVISSNRSIFNDEIKRLVDKVDQMNTLLKVEILELKQEIKAIKKDYDDLKQSVEHADETLSTKIKNINTKLSKNIDDNITKTNDALSDLQSKQNELEDRARRNNIRVDGIEESESETWEET